MKYTQGMAVLVMMVLAVGFVAAQDMEMIESHLGNEGPAFHEGMTPESLGWGADDQAYPDRFVVYRDGSELVWVPAGSFPMGSTDAEVAELLMSYSGPEDDLIGLLYRAEIPQRMVEMDGFWIQKHAVTNVQYRAFCDSTGREFPPGSDQGDYHPVVWVSWDDAVSYAEHYGLGLPTEAQWEYVARGPAGLRYPWGDEWDPERLCWDENRGPGDRSFTVGSFPDGVSWCGALDIVGNVLQWCADWYDPNYYQSAQGSNPTGAIEGDARVVRGGTWYLDRPESFRAAFRNLTDPATRYISLGFRCALTP